MTQSAPQSPRGNFIYTKFKAYDTVETVLANYACAAKCSILLQGMIYITNKALYFYYTFNDKTLIGYGTKSKSPLPRLKTSKRKAA